MNGWMGKVLRVDLTSGRITKEPLDVGLAHAYVGGRGLVGRMLYDEVGPGVDPLGPDNKLVLGVGPCNGTHIPGSQRFTVATKSPATGLYGDSNSGGSFGAAFKYAGYDALIVEGRAFAPVYLWIDDDTVELRAADHLWGRTTRETARAVVREIGDPDISTIAIGPAGENLVAYASVIGDLGRALGRCGVGAVFGSKRLKAVAARGTRGVRVADPRGLAKAINGVYRAWEGNWAEYGKVAAYGQSRAAPYQGGALGDHNFKGGDPAGWNTMMSFENQAARYVKCRACFSCAQGCDHMWVVTQGPFRGAYGEGMQLWPMELGARLDLYDLDAVLALGTLGDELGLDYFDLCQAVAYAMECYETGFLTLKDTGGLRLEWGNQDAIHRLIGMIARREGIGDVLAESLARIPQIVGAGTDEFMIQAKGMTFPSRDPRASKGWGLAYAVSNRGPCHIRAFLPEGMPDHCWDSSLGSITEKYKDARNRIREEGKAELVCWHENLLAFKNCLEVCLINSEPWMFSESAVPFSMADLAAQFLTATTGVALSADEALHVGERIINVERAFNVREGLTRAADTLPKRMLKEGMREGFARGQVVNLDPMLDEYYAFRGWDVPSGLPTRRKLMELSLQDIAEDLERRGLLIEA